MSIKTTDPVVSTMAALLGKKGGSKRTAAQTAARKKNMRKALNARMSKHNAKAA